MWGEHANSTHFGCSTVFYMCPCHYFLPGRIPFYDQYGVIRDVIQNHLTEVMALLTMRLPTNVTDSEELLQNKLRLFSSVLPLGKNQAVVGQYQAYRAEVQQELNKTKDHVSITPTFAGQNGRCLDEKYWSGFLFCYFLGGADFLN